LNFQACYLMNRIPTAGLVVCLAVLALACTSPDDTQSGESVAESAFSFESQEAAGWSRELKY
jgi:hypothetical protein